MQTDLFYVILTYNTHDYTQKRKWFWARRGQGGLGWPTNIQSLKNNVRNGASISVLSRSCHKSFWYLYGSKIWRYVVVLEFSKLTFEGITALAENPCPECELRKMTVKEAEVLNERIDKIIEENPDDQKLYAKLMRLKSFATLETKTWNNQFEPKVICSLDHRQEAGRIRWKSITLYR